MVYIGLSPSGYGACFGSRITEVRVLSFRLSLMLKKRHRLRTVLFLFHKKLPFGDYGYGKGFSIIPYLNFRNVELNR